MKASERLSAAGLTGLPGSVARPTYDRGALQPGIVHLGVGAFARAHLCVATEAAIHATADLRFGIVGVSLRRPDTRDALAPQDGLYAVAVHDAATRESQTLSRLGPQASSSQPTDTANGLRESLQVVGCLMRVLVAPEAPGAVLDAIAAPTTRIVSLTVTEKGYALDPATRCPRLDLPDIAHDLEVARANAPRSTAGFIVRGLARRRAAGLDGVTLMSLDNLSGNGRALRGLVLAVAEAVEPALADWIDARCSFPGSMVDRIVPRTDDAMRDAVTRSLGVRDAWPVATEAFFDWAIEDRFVAGRPAWSHQPGARFVADAAAWETLKLRMVNGTHTAIACCGVLAGWSTVDAAIAQPELMGFIEALMREEIEPTLPLESLPGLELATYRAQLLARFANPALAHRTKQIAMDTSQKLPPRLLGTVRDRLAQGRPITRLAFAVAAWLHHLRGVDEAGAAYPLDDPLAAPLIEHARRIDSAGDPRARAETAMDLPTVFGPLARSGPFVDAVAQALEALRTQSVRSALARFT